MKLSVDVPVIQKLVGGSLQVKAEDVESTRVTFQGRVPLVFGFQAIQLFYEDGKYTAFEPTERVRPMLAGLPAGLAREAPAHGERKLLIIRNARVRIKD